MGHWQYAVSIARVKEVLKPIPSVRMPRVASFVRGLFNLRGQVMPLLDTKDRLGLVEETPAPAGKARVVVVDAPGGSFGLMVDEVLEVLRCDESALQVPHTISDLPTARFVESVLDLDGRLVFILNLDRIVEGLVEGSGGRAAGV